MTNPLNANTALVTLSQANVAKLITALEHLIEAATDERGDDDCCDCGNAYVCPTCEGKSALRLLRKVARPTR